VCLQIDDGKHRILLTGDIEKYAEKILIDAYGSSLQSDILIAPHHGVRHLLLKILWRKSTRAMSYFPSVI